jgi:hypothetical protein
MTNDLSCIVFKPLHVLNKTPLIFPADQTTFFAPERPAHQATRVAAQRAAVEATLVAADRPAVAPPDR